ncbi:MAG: hypothetical protein LBE20_06700 [Deltaproteobacteria bacterium]|nr:hypothetical protein [Deltaproteobacteria bacterium]
MACPTIRCFSYYYDHEVRGVPIRFEIGEREMEANIVTAVIRHSEVK